MCYFDVSVKLNLKISLIPLATKEVFTFRGKKGLILIITQTLSQSNLMSVKH